MASFNSSTTEVQPVSNTDPYNRLQRTATFRGGAFARWRSAKLGVIGAGVVGARIVLEAVRSGVGGVFLWDFDVGQAENQGSQIARPGEAKVHSIARACDGIRPGIVHGFPHDIRHTGIQSWVQCDVMVDCSDDAALAWPLTETSNGTATPMLRCAVDGRGKWELGRVLCSDGAHAHACQLCSYSLSDLRTASQRMPCLGLATPEREPTLAGGAIATAIAGLVLLQAQRLVTENDVERVHDRELVLDLTHHQLLDIQLERCAQCLSGHRTWQPIELGATADEMTLHELLEFAEEAHHSREVALAAYQHSLNTQAYCACGSVQVAVGTDWAHPPTCNRCGTAMSWLREMQIDRVTRQVATDRNILHTPLDQLGMPMDGAMFLAYGPNRPLQRLLLRSNDQSE